MKLLCIADLHHWEESELEKIKDLEYDVCFLLGDIPQEALRRIERIVEPENNRKLLWGVVGNHDTWDLLANHNILDLRYNVLSITKYDETVVFTGFGGSHRYKYGDYAMLTQQESLEYGNHQLGADVLISHDSMYKLFTKDKHDPAHIGLKGITEYIKRNKIKLNICGHHHQNVQLKKYGCDVVCVYRCSLITYPNLSVEKIF